MERYEDNHTARSTEEQVRTLLDIEAIKSVKARYFRSVDLKRYDEFRALFVDDARIGATFAPGMDIDAFVAAVEARHAGVVTVHHGDSPEINFTGVDTAEAVWAMWDLLEWPAGSGPPEFPGFRGFRGYGHYHETYRRGPHGWKIADLELRRLRVDPF